MILDDIVRQRRQDLERRRREVPETELRSRPLFREERRGFLRALQQPGRRIIAEVKRASPSRGVIRAAFHPAEIATQYAHAGAAAISVLTEERHFLGSIAYLSEIRGAVEVPLLQKDFVVDPYQLTEARACGADAVLLILAILDDATLTELLQQARGLGLDALVEVHDEIELRRALQVRAGLVGINNRDLHTFQTSLEVTERLVTGIPAGVSVVAESGIDSPQDIARLERCGVRAFLIGETLMRSPDPGAKLRQLLGT